MKGMLPFMHPRSAISKIAKLPRSALGPTGAYLMNIKGDYHYA